MLLFLHSGIKSFDHLMAYSGAITVNKKNHTDVDLKNAILFDDNLLLLFIVNNMDQ